MTTQVSDDRPDEKAGTEPPSAAPAPLPPDDRPTEPQPAVAPSAVLPDASLTGDQKRKRRRRRRRHTGPRPPGGDAAAPGSAVEAPGGDVSPVPANAVPIDAISNVPSEAVPGAAPVGDQPRRRRRRRRRKGPRTPDGATATPTPDSAAPAGQNPPLPRSQAARPRNQAGPDWRRQGPGAGKSGSRNDWPRKENSGPRDRDRENKGPRGPKNRAFGKTREAPWKKPEPKLYSFESAVDHGFEDLADEADAGATRRVDWTIVKRTVADQKRAKAVSAVYILRRDGVATEFANLTLARAAVSKTIVHPEKLTRPKADYVNTKK